MIRRDQRPSPHDNSHVSRRLGERLSTLLPTFRFVQLAHPHLKPAAAFWNAPALAGKPASLAWKLPTIATMSTAPICYDALGAKNHMRVWST